MHLEVKISSLVKNVLVEGKPNKWAYLCCFLSIWSHLFLISRLGWMMSWRKWTQCGGCRWTSNKWVMCQFCTYNKICEQHWLVQLKNLCCDGVRDSSTCPSKGRHSAGPFCWPLCSSPSYCRRGLLMSPWAVGRYGRQPACRLPDSMGFPQQPSSLWGPPAAGPAL
jgi:hypothetical protein